MMSNVDKLKLELELAQVEERLAEAKADPGEDFKALKLEVHQERARIRRLLEEGGVRNVADEGGVSIKVAPVAAKATQTIDGGSN